MKTKILEILNSKLVIILLVFGLFFITTIFAGDMIFEGGSLNVSNILHIDESSGYVGIGTSTPNKTLHVVGDTKLRGDVIIQSPFAQTFSIDSSTGTINFEIWGNKYDTGWVSNSDWTNKEFNVTHNLGAHLSEVLIKFLVSFDGTDEESYEVWAGGGASGAGSDDGCTFYEIDDDNIKVQTGNQGVYYIKDDGGRALLDTESYYYKIKIWKLG